MLIKPAAFWGTMFSGTFGLLLLAKYFPVRGSEQTFEIDMLCLSKKMQ